MHLKVAFRLLILIFTAYSGCRPSLERTYSVEEHYDLSATRSVHMNNQLQFSFRLIPDHVPIGQDIFFVATFTNTTDRPIIFREPQQQGVVETNYPETTLLFVVEPVKVDTPFNYPFESAPDKIVWPSVERDEFVTLPPHGIRETRVKLPRLVFRNGKIGDVITLPPGQYLVHMTYTNDYIGYEVKRGEETRYIDVGAWVGKVESSVAPLAITP